MAGFRGPHSHTSGSVFISPPALFLGGAPLLPPPPRPHISLLHPALWLSAAGEGGGSLQDSQRVTTFEGGSGRRDFCPGHVESPLGQPGAAPGQCGRGGPRAPPLSHFTKEVGEARAAH